MPSIPGPLGLAQYPLSSFFYVVEIGDDPKKAVIGASFTEVAGLTQEIETIDYRDGFDLITVPRKIPGRKKYGNVTLTRGVFHHNVEFQEWVNSMIYNDIERKIVRVSLLDSAGLPVIQWILSNAYPIKIEGPSLKSEGNEIAFESIELVHEGIKVEHFGESF